MASPVDLDSVCANALLHLLTRGQPVVPQAIGAIVGSVTSQDVSNIRGLWATSSWVRKLAELVVRRPGQIALALTEETRITDGQILGNLDARATVVEQMLTRNPARFVVDDSLDTPISGPNHVVAWVLWHARQSLVWLEQKAPNTLPERVRETIVIVNKALRNQNVAAVLMATQRRRPDSAAVRAAARSLRPIYAYAVEAFNNLRQVERLEPRGLEKLFKDYVISDMEDWRKLELATALTIVRHLEDVVGQSSSGLPDFLSGRYALSTVGRFEVRWQLSQKQRTFKQLDDSERMVRAIGKALGVESSASRADVAVKNRLTGEVVALVECKWFGKERYLESALDEASHQISWYARNCYPNRVGAAYRLLAHSLIVVSDLGARASVLDHSSMIGVASLDDVVKGRLLDWVRPLTR